MQKQRNPGYWTLLNFTILMALGALFTLIPASTAYKESLLGYRSFCTFAPVSTVACILITGANCIVRKRLFTRQFPKQAA
jgi:hypothetical protein